MGVVYLGEDSKLNRKVAVKVLRKDKTSTEFPKLAARFMCEAKAAARLQNAPCIVKIHTIDKRKNGSPYIVIEYVEGTLLDEFIEKENPSIIWRLDKFQDILEAIACAHKEEVVHRDLKPANIMIAKSNLDKTGLVKIMDFGLALVDNNHTLTVLGQRMGSLSYSSPEQAVGEITDHRTDIYSLGVLLYRLLTGQLPFKAGNGFGLLNKICNEPAPSVQALNSGISNDLSNLVAKCLKKDPSERFESVHKLLDDSKACPERQGDAVNPNSDIIVEPAPDKAHDTHGHTYVENSTNERILEEDRCLIQEYIERPRGDIIEDFANAQVGDLFRFGCYPQGPSGEVEPIIWRVLKRDSDGLLVVAEQGLDCKKYNEKVAETTWADCTLRRWLNKEFLSEAFSSQERDLIKEIELSNNAGPSTADRIFLLTVDEAKSLFANDKDREVKPTAYAIKNGACDASDTGLEKWKGNTCWWLRSRGGDGGYFAACVSIDGYVNSSGGYVYVNCVPDSDGDVSVRPACLLAI